jgi:hypothetical protein
MTELLEQIRNEMRARLAELRPLVDEQRRLQAALDALGGELLAAPRTTSASAAAKAKARAPTPAAATRRTRAPRGANREAVLRAVGDRAGATSAELAAFSGVERNTVYGLLARLVKAGELQTRTLPTGRTGYALAAPRADGLTGAALAGEGSSAAEEPA